jgi:adenylate cyclase
VNAAFRLESCTKELKLDVAIGKTTYQYLCALDSSACQVFREYQVKLKGYETESLAYASTYEDLDRLLDRRSESSA